VSGKGSHAPSLVTLARRTLKATLDRQRSRPTCVLVATSGGPDSQALLHVMAGLREELGLVLHAHGVDHGLRPAAKRELDLARDLARELAVPFRRTRVKVAPGGNLQARARTLRMAALRAAAARARATLIATAHHADDRAETVLQRMLRGTTLRSLAVLPARDGDRLRPFVAARRSDIAAHVARHRIPCATDPSNADPRFLRARVRHELLPVLESLNPGVVAHLNALADEALALGSPDLPLPLPTRSALSALILAAQLGGAALQRATKARILLPGGLVLRLEAPHVEEKQRAQERDVKSTERRET
jgi:tRNA(Ile)-lysidine synthase